MKINWKDWKTVAIASLSLNGLIMVAWLGWMMFGEGYSYREVNYNNRKFTLRINRSTGGEEQFNGEYWRAVDTQPSITWDGKK